jgi:hypothetical protein
VIERFLKHGTDDIARCFPRTRARATLEITVVIDPMGGVQAATVTGASREIAACVASTIARLQFPAPRTGEVQARTTVDVPEAR